MSDTSEPSTPGEETPDPGALRERGDKAEAKVRDLEAQLAAQTRELALTDAGVPREGVGALFRKAYDGELTADAIQASMGEYGLSTDPPPPQAAPAPDGAGVVNTISAGLAPAEPVTSPADQAQAAVDEMLKMDEATLLYELGAANLLADNEGGAAPKLLGEIPEV